MTKDRGPTDLQPARLRRSSEQANQAILARIASGKAMLGTPVNSKAALDELRALSYTWSDGNKALLQQLFTNASIAEDYGREFLIGAIGGGFDLGEEEADAKDWIKRKVRRLEGIVEQVQFMDEPSEAAPIRRHDVDDQTGKVERLLRFNLFARELRTRHGGRVPLDVADEYDVQDLVRAILSLDFDDVRPEEWTPSYAGSASRVDFLLKGEKIVVEVKMTRSGLTDRQLGEELLIDIARYRGHPDCKTLVCLVYDPEHRIRNPVGLAKDLEALGSDLRVRVLVTPP